jgi:FemAB-related protein (PEP-CTERM system-associated)
MTMAISQPSFAIRAASIADSAEAARLDAFVLSSDASTPFHLTGWSRAVERGCAQKSHYLVAEDGDGEIAGVLPLTAARSRLFGRALVSAGFAVDGGILTGSAVAAEQLTAHATALARQLACSTLELRGGVSPGDGWHHDSDTYVGFTRDLASDDDAQLLAIPRKQRAEVRKALGFDLTVETGASQRDRAAHYAAYSESVRNLGTPVFPPALFGAVLDEFGEAADILTIRHKGRAMASVLSLYWRGTVMPYWGGGTHDARAWRANDLMYYALMLHARKEKGCNRFDFGRSKVGTGPAAFKRNWGFEAVSLSYAKLGVDGGELRDINPMHPKYRARVAIWQKLPLWLANRLGPKISRGLG